jgi:hypothetical protein
VRSQGWLATQLAYQLNGLCGRYPEVSHFLQYDKTRKTQAADGLVGPSHLRTSLNGHVDLWRGMPPACRKCCWPLQRRASRSPCRPVSADVRRRSRSRWSVTNDRGFAHPVSMEVEMRVRDGTALLSQTFWHGPM